MQNQAEELTATCKCLPTHTTGTDISNVIDLCMAEKVLRKSVFLFRRRGLIDGCEKAWFHSKC